MSTSLSRASWLLLPLLVAACAQAAESDSDLQRLKPVPANAPLPISDFIRQPLFDNPIINRAGTHLVASVSSREDNSDLLVYDLEKSTTDVLHGWGDYDIFDINWVSDSKLIYKVANRKLYTAWLMAADLGRLNKTYPLMQYSGQSVIGIPESNRTHPLVWIQVRAFEEGNETELVRLNADLEMGHLIRMDSAMPSFDDVPKMRESNDRHIIDNYPTLQKLGIEDGYLSDKDGELAYGYVGNDGVISLYRFATGQWTRTPVDTDDISIVGPGNKPGELVVRGPKQEGKPRALQFMDAATGTPGAVLLQEKSYDFTGRLYRDPTTHEILGVIGQRGGPFSVWFTPEYKAIQKLLDGYFPGKIVSILGSDTAARRFILEVYSDRHPASYYQIDLEAHKLTLIQHSRPWVDPDRSQPMNIMKFKTRDGHLLDAYVTLPKGASKEHPAPLVVFPHRDMLGRSTWGYDPMVQYLASRGYAVLQPNYRSSPGYQWMFPNDDRFALRKLSDDVTDATQTLLQTGMVDPKRVGIMGYDFGAYLALSGAVHDPSLYRCMVAIEGIFDYEIALSEYKFSDKTSNSYAYWKRKLGDPSSDKGKYDLISPLRHIDQMHAAAFVAYEKESAGSTLRQSSALVSELNHHNVPSEVYAVSYIDRYKNRIELYTRLEAFLAKYLTP